MCVIEHYSNAPDCLIGIRLIFLYYEPGEFNTVCGYDTSQLYHRYEALQHYPSQ